MISHLYTLILGFCLLIASTATAQNFEAPLPGGETPVIDEMDELPIENGKINVEKLTQKMDMQAGKILARINEIDALVNKAFAEKAAEVYGIEATEYDFLRRQAEVDSKPLTDFFRTDRRSRVNGIDAAHQYFTYAYDAIRKNEYWYGREESLLSKDKSLYATMKQEVATELAATAEGVKILDLEAEKNRLLQLMETQKPLFEYLIERRKWWELYPDYKDLVEQVEAEKKLRLTP